jgi:hypothetical protein
MLGDLVRIAGRGAIAPSAIEVALDEDAVRTEQAMRFAARPERDEVEVAAPDRGAPAQAAPAPAPRGQEDRERGDRELPDRARGEGAGSEVREPRAETPDRDDRPPDAEVGCGDALAVEPDRVRVRAIGPPARVPARPDRKQRSEPDVEEPRRGVLAVVRVDPAVLARAVDDDRHGTGVSRLGAGRPENQATEPPGGFSRARSQRENILTAREPL